MSVPLSCSPDMVPSSGLSNGSRAVFPQRPGGGTLSLEDMDSCSYGIQADVP
jgi:hypothetical protein